MCLDGLTNAGDLGARQIVHDDDVARPENRRQKSGPDGLAVPRAIERHGRAGAIKAQHRDEGRCAPMAMRRLGHKPLADGTTAIRMTC